MPSVHNAALKREKCHKRQNGICPICGMALSLRETGEMAATLDHILPKSRGGGGSLDNLRAVHKICNKLRGNDVSDIITEIEGVRAFRWDAFAAAVIALLLVLPAHAEPYTLVTIWPSGHVKHEPATTRATCELAMTDALDGFALPLDEMLPATAAHCEKRDSFPKGWDVIPGYNAPRRK